MRRQVNVHSASPVDTRYWSRGQAAYGRRMEKEVCSHSAVQNTSILIHTYNAPKHQKSPVFKLPLSP